ncbi:hypothetical protein [Streptomyces sp. RKAG337]|uniref:hypothetical protein n=1 Tax=Streptomyces sp. RKAG337 TaxID=2893404 RepID=UPI0027E45FF5|nr:hypothetical protein [Streptomyces sp. RKAG337]
MKTSTTHKIAAGAAAVLASGTLTLAAVPVAHADDTPAASAASASTAPAAAREAAAAPATLDTLSRFFARDGGTALKGATKAAAPHLEGATVTVNTLNPGFVAGDRGAAVALPEFAATKAVSADGHTASVWTVRSGAGWKVVNIATGSDETDYVAKGGAQPGSTVFREPQIDAWYVVRGAGSCRSIRTPSKPSAPPARPWPATSSSSTEGTGTSCPARRTTGRVWAAATTRGPLPEPLPEPLPGPFPQQSVRPPLRLSQRPPRSRPPGTARRTGTSGRAPRSARSAPVSR